MRIVKFHEACTLPYNHRTYQTTYTLTKAQVVLGYKT